MTLRDPARAFLFDLDGTLLDTAPDLAGALNRVRAEDDLAPMPYAEIRPHVSNGSFALIRLGFDFEDGTAAFERRRVRLLKHYRDNVAEHTRLFPGMEAVLERIEASDRPWGIVTNKPAWLTNPLLDALALDRRAACVISGDSTPRAKPHPDPLLAAAKLVGAAPDACLYVGDAERDIQAARAARMPVVIARYGYIGADEDPHAWGGDGHVDTPAGLMAWL